MAQKSEPQTQDSWSEGITQWRQAVEHNVTASRLLATGAIAIGAAATAYFWDPSRRSAFMDTTKRFGDDMSNWFGGLYSGGSRSDGGEANSGNAAS